MSGGNVEHMTVAKIRDKVFTASVTTIESLEFKICRYLTDINIIES